VLPICTAACYILHHVDSLPPAAVGAARFTPLDTVCSLIGAGESERRLREAFAAAGRDAQTGRPVVIFLDEVSTHLLLLPPPPSPSQPPLLLIACTACVMRSASAIGAPARACQACASAPTWPLRGFRV
jgi:hypothetical protein